MAEKVIFIFYVFMCSVIHGMAEFHADLVKAQHGIKYYTISQCVLSLSAFIIIFVFYWAFIITLIISLMHDLYQTRAAVQVLNFKQSEG